MGIVSSLTDGIVYIEGFLNLIFWARCMAFHSFTYKSFATCRYVFEVKGTVETIPVKKNLGFLANDKIVLSY